ncbi:hypothetical protein [Flavobacterium endophyticum]|uniref:hypothetical protein n=1 Tax=Flavobacterium endophyticum TaxID=1540163 RepID=UPI001474A2F1|nr:hypothetical protein [Flavobacterium endophyticum]
MRTTAGNHRISKTAPTLALSYTFTCVPINQYRNKRSKMTRRTVAILSLLLP